MQEYTPELTAQQAAGSQNEPDAETAGAESSAAEAVSKENPAAQAAAPADEAVEVVDVRFRNNAKIYYFDPCGLSLNAGEHVVIDTARGDEFGLCTGANHTVRAAEVVLPLRKVLRRATAQDERTNQENLQKEKKAFEVCQQKIQERGMQMQLVSAECAFDGSKILFFFTADGRVDFRELVKDLASVFRTRIELRQIGVRDKAKMVGGLGVCGRPFCCKEFLDDFQPVSIKMAKTQNLSLNPTKISGTCGRLMCCLKYEQEAYEDLLKTAPKNESFVDTPDGRGTVTEVNLLRQCVKVRMEDHPENIGCYHNCDICVLRNGKARKNDPPIPKDLAPISSKPRPVVKKDEPFEALPEVIYNDDVVTVDAPPSDEPAEPAAAKQPEDAAAPRRRRRSRGGKGRGTEAKPESAQQPAPERKPAPKQERRPDSRPERRPAPRTEKKPEGGEAQPSGAQSASRPRRRRPRRPGGAQGQPPKATEGT